MPVTVVVEDGTGLETANAYVDPAGAFAVEYALAWLYKDEWTAADADTKAQAVVMATRTLDAQYEWRGVPLRDGVQSLAWPRVIRGSLIPSDEVPAAVEAATLEMALALLQRNRTSDTNSGSRGLKSIGLGDGALKIEYGSDPTTAPITAIIPANIRALLRDYGDAAGGSMRRVERR